MTKVQGELVQSEPAALSPTLPAVILAPEPSVPPRKRGRPTTIPDDLKLKALQVQGNKARAAILYKTAYPNPQQVKNVRSILRHFERKRLKPE